MLSSLPEGTTASSPLAAQKYVVQTGFSSSVCQAVVGAMRASTTKITSSVGKNGQAGVPERVYQSMPYLFLYLRLGWLNT